jgi:hypothetical protein
LFFLLASSDKFDYAVDKRGKKVKRIIIPFPLLFNRIDQPSTEGDFVYVRHGRKVFNDLKQIREKL